MPHPIELTVIDLRLPPRQAEELRQFLSPDEQARAERFRFPHLQERFLICRGMLRHLLGAACQVPPAQLRFTYSPQGKPGLPGIHFNASHSGDLWACAISRHAPVGLDIEQIRPMNDHEAIARRFFAPAEYQAIVQFPEHARLAAFFRCWTRKEAYIKATGDGLSCGLSTFTVSCAEDRISKVHDWSIESLVLAPGYVGALATR